MLERIIEEDNDTLTTNLLEDLKESTSCGSRENTQDT